MGGQPPAPFTTSISRTIYETTNIEDMLSLWLTWSMIWWREEYHEGLLERKSESSLNRRCRRWRMDRARTRNATVCSSRGAQGPSNWEYNFGLPELQTWFEVCWDQLWLWLALSAWCKMIPKWIGNSSPFSTYRRADMPYFGGPKWPKN